MGDCHTRHRQRSYKASTTGAKAEYPNVLATGAKAEYPNIVATGAKAGYPNVVTSGAKAKYPNVITSLAHTCQGSIRPSGPYFPFCCCDKIT